MAIAPGSPRRLYLRDAAPPVSPAYSGAWVQAGGGERIELTPTLSDTGYRDSVAADTLTTNPNDVLVVQCVSPPLQGPGTLEGTLRGVLDVREGNVGGNMHSQAVVYVVSGDGATVRGVAFGPDTRTDNGTEWYQPISRATIYAFREQEVTLAPVAFSDGDRIVVELGAQARNAGSSGIIAVVRVGDPVAASDLPEVELDTGNGRGWVQFSATVLFEGESLEATTGDGAVELGLGSSGAGASVLEGAGEAAFELEAAGAGTPIASGVGAVELTLSVVGEGGSVAAASTGIPLTLALTGRGRIFPGTYRAPAVTLELADAPELALTFPDAPSAALALVDAPGLALAPADAPSLTLET